MKKTKYVYICHPLKGDIEGNLERVKDIVRNVCNKEDAIPFAPHLAFAPVFDDLIPEERALGISTDVALLRSGKIDELWVYGHKLSEGMKYEVEICVDQNIPVHCKVANLRKEVQTFIRDIERKKAQTIASMELSTPEGLGTPLRGTVEHDGELPILQAIIEHAGLKTGDELYVSKVEVQGRKGLLVFLDGKEPPKNGMLKPIALQSKP